MKYTINSAAVAWFVDGTSMLRGTIYNEVPPLWLGVAFIIGAVSIALYSFVVMRRLKGAG